MKNLLDPKQIRVLRAHYNEQMRHGLEPFACLDTDTVNFEQVLAMMPQAIHHAEDDADRYKLEMRHLENEWLVCYANNESEYLSFVRYELIDALFCVLVDIDVHEFIPVLL